MNKLLIQAQAYVEPAIAAAFLVAWAFAETGRHQILPGQLSIVLPWWAALVAVCLAMALARILPLVAMTLSLAVVLAQLVFPYTAGFFGGTDGAIYFGFLVVVFGVSAGVRRRWQGVSFIFAVGLAIAVAGLMVGWGRLDWSGPIPLPAVGDGVEVIIANRVLIFIAAIVLSLSAWFLGASARVWQQKLSVNARLAETTSELNRAEIDLLISRERDLLAQDVHDIMAHSLSVIIAQADGARFVAAERPDAVIGTLSNIADSARASLTDVRRLIETLVSDPVDPAPPRLDELQQLVERMGSAGLEVTVEVFGEPLPLGAVQELATYRIVQESLTNALKHGGVNATARVAFDWRGPGLALAVTSRSGTALPQPDSERAARGEGRGLRGMRDRAQLAGGWLKAEPDDADPGTYIVTAFIPAVRTLATA